MSRGQHPGDRRCPWRPGPVHVCMLGLHSIWKDLPLSLAWAVNSYSSCKTPPRVTSPSSLLHEPHHTAYASASGGPWGMALPRLPVTTDTFPSRLRVRSPTPKDVILTLCLAGSCGHVLLSTQHSWGLPPQHPGWTGTQQPQSSLRTQGCGRNTIGCLFFPPFHSVFPENLAHGWP